MITPREEEGSSGPSSEEGFGESQIKRCSLSQLGGTRGREGRRRRRLAAAPELRRTKVETRRTRLLSSTRRPQDRLRQRRPRYLLILSTSASNTRCPTLSSRNVGIASSRPSPIPLSLPNSAYLQAQLPRRQPIPHQLTAAPTTTPLGLIPPTPTLPTPPDQAPSRPRTQQLLTQPPPLEPLLSSSQQPRSSLLRSRPSSKFFTSTYPTHLSHGLNPYPVLLRFSSSSDGRSRREETEVEEMEGKGCRWRFSRSWSSIGGVGRRKRKGRGGGGA